MNRLNFLKCAMRRGAILAVAVAIAVVFALMADGQTPATLTDLGAPAPIPGPADISQLSTNGDTTFPDGLNYYNDNDVVWGTGEPGQTFTTPATTNGYILTSLAVESAGLDSGGGSPETAVNYVLNIYSVSDGNASLLASYITASPVSYGEGDWLQWTGLSVPLFSGTTYAYSFGSADGSSGWDAIAVAGGNPYPGGEIALISPAGGAMTFGDSHSYDATFDIGLISVAPGQPAVANLAVTGVEATAATLNGEILSAGGNVPTVTFYYGTTDGGTNAANWQNAVAIGEQSGAFSLTVPCLASSATYFYTACASNSGGTSWAAPSQSFTTLTSNPAPTPVAVLTYHNDNARDGANTNETALTLADINTGSFGRLFSYPVDGYIYAQPLVMTNVNIPGQGVHDVVYVVTEHDTIYAFDADGNMGTNGGLLWSTNLGPSALSSSGDFGTAGGTPYMDLIPEVGITGTPVIDPVCGTIYFDVLTFDGTNSNGGDIYNHRVHAFDIATGSERPYSPVLVAASVPGWGVDSTNGVVTFNAEQQLQRPGLTLAGGNIYVAYGSYGDTDPYHGWVLGFAATNLQLWGVFNTTPNASIAAFGPSAGEAGIWMSGCGLCVDACTNLYFEIANGSFSANTNGGDYGDSIVRLSITNGLQVVDYFTPYDQAMLQADDEDLGSPGAILLPDSAGSAAYPHLLVGDGKEGTIYLVDRDNMGQYNPIDNSQILQSIPGATASCTGTSPAYFNGSIYYQCLLDVMKAFQVSNAYINPSPVSQSVWTYNYGAPVSISANGNDDAIAWSIQIDGYMPTVPGILRAYNATNLSQELYDSSQNAARDNPANGVKFSAPTIAGGKVYVGGQYGLTVYGNGVFLSTPVIAPDGGSFTNSVTVNLLGAPTGVNLYYTLDGSAPTTNSILYTGPFTLTNNATVQAIAAAPGAVNSPAVSASFNVQSVSQLPPPSSVYFTSAAFSTNGQFQLGFSGVAGNSYILEATTNFVDWVPLETNPATANLFDLFDPEATNFPYRFYRVLQQ